MVYRVRKAWENPLRDQELNRWVEERPKASLGEIRVIVGGSMMAGSLRKAKKTYLRMVQNVQLIGCPPKFTWMDDPMISFTEENAQRLHYPHDDALVINLTITNFNTQWVLVDNGILVDILYYPTFQQMRIGKERLMPLNVPLVGFGGTKVMLVGSITLLVTISTYPQQITKDVTFLVVDCSLAYNAIIGQPTLN